MATVIQCYLNSALSITNDTNTMAQGISYFVVFTILKIRKRHPL